MKWIYSIVTVGFLVGCSSSVSDEDIQKAADDVTNLLTEQSQNALDTYFTEDEEKIFNSIAEQGSNIVEDIIQGEDISFDLEKNINTLKEASNLIVPKELTKVTGTVERTVDGDTLIVQFDQSSIETAAINTMNTIDNSPLQSEETLRLFSVDAPESVGNYADNPMPFGKKASDYLKELLEGKEVHLLVSSDYEKDPYGRLLAFVTHQDVSVQGLLLKEGLARVAYTKPGTPFYDEFIQLQETAKKEKRGIWSIEDYVQDGYNLDAVP